MAQRSCIAEGCERPCSGERGYRSKGYCRPHHRRWRATGDPGPAEIQQKTPAPKDGICTVEDCTRKARSRGWCNAHYRRWQRHGDPGTAEIIRQERTECSFDGCGRVATCRGLCDSHADQVSRGKELTPLRDFYRPTIRDDLGRKRCSACKEWRHEAEFQSHVRSADGLLSRCKRCYRENQWLRKFGISPDQYAAMLKAQGGGCAVCGEQCSSGKALAIDHDHSCCPGQRTCGKCVRGLLCQRCNLGIGMFGEDPQRLWTAMVYVAKART